MIKVQRRVEPIILLALFMIYLIVLSKITIFRDSSSEVQNVNLIPFNTIAEYLQSILSGNKMIGISNLLGNLIIFFPLGYMSASLFPEMRKLIKILMLVFAFSAAIEVFQYIFACGAADIDDVILNTVGGVIGYWIYALIARFIQSKKFAIFISASMIAVICIGFFAVGNYRFLVDLPAPGIHPARIERHNEYFSEPLTIDEQPTVHLSTGAVANPDFDTADAQINVNETVWRLILVNKWNYVPDDYEVELTELANGQSVDKRIYPALQELFDAARSQGVYPIVVSGYRTAEKQQTLMDEKIAEYRAEGYSTEDAITKAATWVSIPGTSEHQLGIAVDINADGIHSAGHEVYDWLEQNAYKYGFILRYPPGKTEITEVIYEPWHYRYVGIETATEIYNQGVCLEEYLNMVN